MFTPPARAGRIRAVGPVAGLPPALRRALDEQGFDPIPRPGPHDWLACQPEPGQTFAAFLARHPPSPDRALLIVGALSCLVYAAVRLDRVGHRDKAPAAIGTSLSEPGADPARSGSLVPPRCPVGRCRGGRFLARVMGMSGFDG